MILKVKAEDAGVEKARGWDNSLPMRRLRPLGKTLRRAAYLSSKASLLSKRDGGMCHDSIVQSDSSSERYRASCAILRDAARCERIESFSRTSLLRVRQCHSRVL